MALYVRLVSVHWWQKESWWVLLPRFHWRASSATEEGYFYIRKFQGCISGCNYWFLYFVDCHCYRQCKKAVTASTSSNLAWLRADLHRPCSHLRQFCLHEIVGQRQNWYISQRFCTAFCNRGVCDFANALTHAILQRQKLSQVWMRRKDVKFPAEFRHDHHEPGHTGKRLFRWLFSHVMPWTYFALFASCLSKTRTRHGVLQTERRAATLSLGVGQCMKQTF